MTQIGTAASREKALLTLLAYTIPKDHIIYPAPATKRKKMNSPILVDPLRNAPETNVYVADCDELVHADVYNERLSHRQSPISGQIYQSDSAPGYTLGQAWSAGSLAFGWCRFWVLRMLYKRREREKEELRATGWHLGQGEVWTDRVPEFKYQF